MPRPPGAGPRRPTGNYQCCGRPRPRRVAASRPWEGGGLVAAVDRAAGLILALAPLYFFLKCACLYITVGEAEVAQVNRKFSTNQTFPITAQMGTFFRSNRCVAPRSYIRSLCAGWSHVRSKLLYRFHFSYLPWEAQKSDLGWLYCQKKQVARKND